MREQQSMRARVWAVAAVSAFSGLAAPGAFAQSQALTSEPVELYAGPSADYPVVSEVGPNVAVQVMGCVNGYSWCDVALPGLRGWVYAGYLTYPYQGGYVPVESYGAAIGLPVVTFVIGDYWGSFYRDRPWYGEREHWAHVPPPGYGARPPGPPPAHGGPPPGAPPSAHGGPPPGGPPPQGAGRPPPPAAAAVQGNVARPPAAPPQAMPPRAPAPPAAMARPPALPQGYPHAAPAQPLGGAHPPGPPQGNARTEPEHSSSHENGGHGDSRQQN
jgi:uncharacterized protein YraI